MERVRLVSGKNPIIIVAPHGFKNDDERTALIAEEISKFLQSYAVINLGWERHEKVDYMLDFADCNNIKHCHEDVVKEEFLDPIIRFKNRILKQNKKVHIFYIHGMSNKHRVMANDPTMDIVVGYGTGLPNSFSCETWKKDLFVNSMERLGISTYEGSLGGPMSGWTRNNLNQLFRKWYFEPLVQSMQIEIVHELREDDDISKATAEYVAEAIERTANAKEFKTMNLNKIY